MRHPNPWRQFAVIATVFLLVFSAARLALLVMNWPQFARLSSGEILWAFFHGLRFDASTVALATGLPFLMSLLPFRWAQSRAWQAFWLWTLYGVLLILVLALVSDMVYFSYVQRHVGAEITLALDDVALFKGMVLDDYGWALALFLVAAVSGGLLWRRIIPLRVRNPLRPLPGGLALLLLAGVLIVLIRGGFQYKPIALVDAFAAVDSPEQGYLALNGAFAIQRSLGDKGVARAPKFMDGAAALAHVKAAQGQAAFYSPRDDYPLLRQATAPRGAANRPNVVLLLMESWDAEHIDALRRQAGKPALGLTPNFDRLAQQGMLFTQFYANGRRSIEGLAAILASVPSLPTLPYLGKGLEQNRLSWLGRLARNEGYQTIFLQSSKRGSFHLDAIAKQAGFQDYLGAEDIPADPRHPYASQSDWGVWDHYTLHEANRRFAQAARPFLGMVFTSTTHNPFRVPDAKWQRDSHDDDHARYKNTLYYADWALGQLLAQAKASGYFDDTIWLITGDHIGPFGATAGVETSLYHIPLLVVGPGIRPGVNPRLGSQLDLLPTLADVLHWQTPFAGFGVSLLSDAAQPTVLGVNDKLLNFFDGRGWITHDLNHTLEKRPLAPNADFPWLEQQLLAHAQTINDLVTQNRLLP